MTKQSWLYSVGVSIRSRQFILFIFGFSRDYCVCLGSRFCECIGCRFGGTLFGFWIRMMKCRIDNDLAMRDFFFAVAQSKLAESRY